MITGMTSNRRSGFDSIYMKQRLSQLMRNGAGEGEKIIFYFIYLLVHYPFTSTYLINVLTTT